MKNICEGDIYFVPPVGLMKYLGKHPLMGECVGILDSNGNEIVKIVFYPLKLNIRSGNARFYGHSTPLAIPTIIRRPKIIKNQHVESWLIDDGIATRETELLTEELTKLPVGAVVSHQMLLEWQRGGWHFLLGNFD